MNIRRTPLSGIKTINDLRNKQVEIRNEREYISLLSVVLSLGGSVWPNHKGYVEIPEEDKGRVLESGRPYHHLYGWNDAGFFKQAGVGEDSLGTFISVDEFITHVRRITDREESPHTLKYLDGRFVYTYWGKLNESGSDTSINTPWRLEVQKTNGDESKYFIGAQSDIYNLYELMLDINYAHPDYNLSLFWFDDLRYSIIEGVELNNNTHEVKGDIDLSDIADEGKAIDVYDEMLLVDYYIDSDEELVIFINSDDE